MNPRFRSTDPSGGQSQTELRPLLAHKKCPKILAFGHQWYFHRPKLLVILRFTMHLDIKYKSRSIAKSTHLEKPKQLIIRTKMSRLRVPPPPRKALVWRIEEEACLLAVSPKSRELAQPDAHLDYTPKARPRGEKLPQLLNWFNSPPQLMWD